MFKVTFKDLEPSDLLRNTAAERIRNVCDKYPEMENHDVQIVLSMENSPRHPGPDLFGVGVRIKGRWIRSLVINKKASNIYVALGELCDVLQDQLNRRNDKRRDINRRRRREAFQRMLDLEISTVV